MSETRSPPRQAQRGQATPQSRVDCRWKPSRTDGFLSLGVLASAALVAIGLPRADPLIGLAITLVILRISWDSWNVVRGTQPGEATHLHEH